LQLETRQTDRQPGREANSYSR